MPWSIKKTDAAEGADDAWWSTGHGWGDRSAATAFTDAELATVTLPPGGEWVRPDVHDNARAVLDAFRDVTETEALYLVGLLALRYGWAASVFTREDARGEWEAQSELLLDGDEEPAPFDDDAWARVRSTGWWRKVLNQPDDTDWHAIGEAVAEALRVVRGDGRTD